MGGGIRSLLFIVIFHFISVPVDPISWRISYFPSGLAPIFITI